MSLVLYDLALADESVRLSPYCWTVKFGLLHKALNFETIAVPFADKSKYPDPEYGKVPVLLDGGKMIKDSLVIADYLEEKFPAHPLLQSSGERASMEFYRAWLGAVLYPALAPLLIPRIAQFLPDADKDYFRSSRELRFGKPLEEVARTPGLVERIEAAFSLLGAPLRSHAFLGGDAPNQCDYLVMGPIMWERAISAHELYETPKAVEDWRTRMLDLFGGYAGNARCAEAA
jgi:glutathione S-transferase